MYALVNFFVVMKAISKQAVDKLKVKKVKF